MSVTIEKRFTIDGGSADVLSTLCELVRRYIRDKRDDHVYRNGKSGDLCLDEYSVGEIYIVEELMSDIWEN